MTKTIVLPTTPLEVISEGASVAPNEEYEELDQYARDYAFASMDKATKFKEFTRQKDDCQLE